MARLEYHRDRLARYERVLKKRFPQGAASLADTGKLLGLRLGLLYEHAVAEWCEEALEILTSGTEHDCNGTSVTTIDNGRRESKR